MGRGRGEAMAPLVQFRDPNGKTIKFTADIASSPPSHHVGEAVTVLYDPRTGRSMIDSFSTIYGPFALFLALGGFFVLFGAFPFIFAAFWYIYAIRPARKADMVDP